MFYKMKKINSTMVLSLVFCFLINQESCTAGMPPSVAKEIIRTAFILYPFLVTWGYFRKRKQLKEAQKEKEVLQKILDRSLQGVPLPR